MSSLILWLDTEEARLFHLLPSGTQTERVRRSGHRHPAESLGVNHPIDQTDEEGFYRDLTARLEKVPASEILVVGPGPGRLHFMNHLERRQRGIVEKVCGTFRLDQMTDAQIVDFGKDYFRHHHVFASAR